MKNYTNYMSEKSDKSKISCNKFCHLCLEASFPQDACDALCYDFNKIFCFSPAYTYLTDSVYIYQIEERLDFCQRQEIFENLCKEIGIHEYSAQMIFYICFLPVLKSLYKKKNLSEEMFSGVLAGIKCKLDECYSVYGIYGSFVAVWFSRFFNFTLFPIGRLEFAPISSPVDIEHLGIKKGDHLIDVHIPSRGTLQKSGVIESYKKALKFFDEFYKRKHKGFFCESWLIYPKNKTIIPECKNIMDFMSDFCIYNEEADNGDLWRIFGSSALCYPDGELTCKTYLQKQYKKHLDNGGTMGLGFGIYLI